MSRSRIAMSLLEAMIATAIFTSVLVAVFEALNNGVQTANLVTRNDAYSDQNARTLRSVVNMLRYADVNRIYLDGTAWTTQVSGSDYYSFKLCTGFNVTNGSSAASLDRTLLYGQGVVLRFSPNPDKATGSLYQTTFNLDPATAIPTSTAQAERLLIPNLAWRYTPAGTTTPMPGFQIVQLDPTQTSVVGNQIEVRVAALTGLVAGGQPVYRDIRSTVYLRTSMYQGLGLLAPVITSPATASANQGSPFIYDIIATNDPTRFSATGLPTFLTCDPFSGRISGTPTTTGTWSCLVTATNEAGSGSSTLDLVVKGPLPQITSPLVINTVVNSPVLYQTSATNAPTLYAATGLPPNLLIGSSSGIISGTIPAVGSWTAILTVSNSNGSVSAALTINATSAPLPAPVVTSGSATAGSGQPFTYQITASNSPTAYAAAGLPGGLTLNPSTGLISGTTSNIGYYTVALSASNAAGSGTGTLNLSVQQPACVITSASSATAIVGASFTYQITATNSPTSYAISAQPAWLVLNPATGKLAGVPTATGIYNVNLAASNQVGTGYGSLALTVSNPEPPGITLTNPLNAKAGVLFSYTPTVTPAVPTQWSVSGLPPGVVLASSSTGAVSGSPTVVGSFIANFTATNLGGSTSATTTIIVSANPNLPIVTLGANTGNGVNFQVLGSVAAANGMTLDLATFAMTSNQSLTLYRGWIPAEANASKTSLSTNQFLLTGKSLSGVVTISASITDTTGNVGSASRSY